MTRTEPGPALEGRPRRGRKILRAAASAILIAATFGFAIPRIASYRSAWATTPVVDSLCARADADGEKLALLGVSQAGYWVPRALAFEHRIAAVVADPGVVDVSTTVLGHLPHMMIKLLEAGERDKFNRDMDHPDHHPRPGHQPRQRAILAGPVPGTVRQAHRQKGDRRVQRGRGADSHCEPAGSGIRGERIIDWLDEQVPA